MPWPATVTSIELFARTGYWTHQWIALRNLAILLRRLGDVETAEVIEAAADVAPDAPATPATTKLTAVLTADRSRESVRARRHLSRDGPTSSTSLGGRSSDTSESVVVA